MIYVFDIDGTICNNTYGDDDNAKPYKERIEKNNKLYEDGHTIIYHTARGMGRTNNNLIKVYQIFYNYTSIQLGEWGVKYHDLFMGKPSGDVYVDDKAQNIGNFYEN